MNTCRLPYSLFLSQIFSNMFSHLHELTGGSKFMPTQLNVACATSMLNKGLAHISAGLQQIDLSRLTQFDSTALALLLAWRRAAIARNQLFKIIHYPKELKNLANAYGVDTLLFDINESLLASSISNNKA